MLGRVAKTCAGMPTSRGLAPPSTTTATRLTLLPYRQRAPVRLLRRSGRASRRDPRSLRVCLAQFGQDRLIRPFGIVGSRDASPFAFRLAP